MFYYTRNNGLMLPSSEVVHWPLATEKAQPARCTTFVNRILSATLPDDFQHIIQDDATTQYAEQLLTNAK